MANNLFNAGHEKYPALTGIRAVGASVVFFDHFPMFGTLIGINVMSFFYVLSGFLIVRIYYVQTEMTGNWLSKYFVNRYARIYPVYFLLLTIAVFLRHEVNPWVLFKNYTLTHGLFYSYKDFIISPSWSLTVEECFYFLAPLIIIIIKKYHFFVSLVFGFLLLLAALVISKLNIGFLQTPLFVFSTTFFGHFLEFFAGIYLALVVMKLEKQGSFQYKGIKYTICGVLGITLLVGAMMFVYLNPPLNHYAIVLINNFLIPFPVALFYFGLMGEKTFLSKLLASRLAGILGRASYSFYLLHTIIIKNIAAPFLVTHPGVSTPLCVMVTYIGTYMISIALFFFYEEPLNLLIRKKLHSKNKRIGMTETLFYIPGSK